MPSPFLSTLSLSLLFLPSVLAKPRLRPAPLFLNGRSAIDARFATLLPRQNCANPCGYNDWLCCDSSGSCYTDSAGDAQCGVTAAAAQAATSGYWEYWTSTFVVTDTETRTAVYSSWVGAPSVTQASCEIPCGSTCCSAGENCLIASEGVCEAGSTPGGIPAATATGTASVALRPTTSGVVVVTGTTVRATTTVPFESAVPTGTSLTVTTHHSGGLSGGAIAGIVIGVLAGIFLLILICLFCCARAIFDSILAIFGLGKKKHTHEETYIEEHHHHGSAGGGRWYGQNRPGRPKKESRFGGLGGAAGVGAALGGLALLLGLKRRHDRKHEEKSDYTSTYYSSDYTSSSSASSDRHTRRTHDTRRTRDTRRSSHRGSRRS